MSMRTKLLATAGATVASAAIAVPASQAHAATPSCVAHKYYNMVAGGCNGNNTSGSDQLWLECKVNGASFYYYINGSWHNRYADWQQDLFCSGGNAAAVAVGFNHRS
ncbi:MAG TPA: hypothetical protein VFD73_10950 [Gemmatimonadales bacterium]|nr:hypothetical protein [Gemmatimonadales bacterium]